VIASTVTDRFLPTVGRKPIKKALERGLGPTVRQADWPECCCLRVVNFTRLKLQARGSYLMRDRALIIKNLGSIVAYIKKMGATVDHNQSRHTVYYYSYMYV
jgi:hypothetical protein